MIIAVPFTNFGLIQFDGIEINVKPFKLNNGQRPKLLIHFHNSQTGDYCRNNHIDSDNGLPLGHEIPVPVDKMQYLGTNQVELENWVLGLLGLERA